MPRPRTVLVLASLSAIGACLQVMRAEIELVESPPAGEVQSAVRVFMADGSLVRFPEGFRVVSDSIHGAGTWHDLGRGQSRDVRGVALDSVLGMESYDERIDLLSTLVVSAFATVGAALGVVVLSVAIFGSCPTVYSHGPAGELLEAEAFSYSISPLLEGTDVDRLTARPDADGRLTLEIRNEALETHFINHLALEVVDHAPGETIVPDPAGLPLAVGPLRAVSGVLDRSGRDVTDALAREDDAVFASAPERLAAATAEDSRDWLELTLPPTGADSAALVFTLRNSLLNTVLFYDLMLASQGAAALDWLRRDIERIGYAVELGSWYQRTMGMWVEVAGASGWTGVTRVPDTGPIAWKRLAVTVPVHPDRPTRVRLSFLVDEWRIDRIAWSDEVTSARTATVPVREVRRDDGSEDVELLDRILDVDDRYLVTTPGTAFHVTFDTGDPPRGERTVLLRSQGYYTEWIRPDWVRNATGPTPFEPSPETVGLLLDRWREAKAPMERDFHRSRIPVR